MARKKDGRGGRRPGAGRPKKDRVPAKLPKEFTRLLAKMTEEEMRELAREQAALAIGTLVAVATDGDKDTARVSAANALLDRGFGRPSSAGAPKAPAAGAGDAPRPPDESGWEDDFVAPQRPVQ